MYYGEFDFVGFCIIFIIIFIIFVGYCIIFIMIFIYFVGFCIMVSLILYGVFLIDFYNFFFNWFFGLDVVGVVFVFIVVVLMIVNSCIIFWLYLRGICLWLLGCGLRGGNLNIVYSYCVLLFSGVFYSLSLFDSVYYYCEKEGIYRIFRVRNWCVFIFRWGLYIYYFII